MLGIATRPENGELLFWCGGEIFSVHKEEAVRIAVELDVLAPSRSQEKQWPWPARFEELQMKQCKIIKGSESFQGKQGLTYFSGVSAESSGSDGICMHMLGMPLGTKGCRMGALVC